MIICLATRTSCQNNQSLFLFVEECCNIYEDIPVGRVLAPAHVRSPILRPIHPGGVGNSLSLRVNMLEGRSPSSEDNQATYVEDCIDEFRAGREISLQYTRSHQLESLLA